MILQARQPVLCISSPLISPCGPALMPHSLHLLARFRLHIRLQLRPYISTPETWPTALLATCVSSRLQLVSKLACILALCCILIHLLCDPCHHLVPVPVAFGVPPSHRPPPQVHRHQHAHRRYCYRHHNDHHPYSRCHSTLHGTLSITFDRCQVACSGAV